MNESNRGHPPVKHPETTLPYAWFLPIIAGLVAGLVLRFVFSAKAGEPFATMMASFIFLTPLLVGAVTVYVAERQRRRSWMFYFFGPLLANFMFVFSTLMILWEGLICAVLIVPIFALFGAMGGVAMGIICRTTGWPTPALGGLAILPLLFGVLETNMPLPDRFETVERQVSINAPPVVVWQFLQDTGRIRPEEVEQGWMYRIGVPLPEFGVTETVDGERMRRVRMGKGIHFDQIVIDEVPERHVSWAYRFYPDSVPPQALDDHVAIGGAHFDMIGTSYTLSPNGHTTDLRIRMNYRVSTQFNWYAVPLANLLFGNFEETVLDFYRRRSESAVVAGDRHE